MIKFENTEIMNFEGALRGMRNPMESWDKSDSTFIDVFDNYENLESYYTKFAGIGENDLDLAQRLIKAGPDHRKFMRQIFVCVDITAPLYWWKEFDTYKVGTVSNSCSTMHKIHAKPIEVSDFSLDNMSVEFDTGDDPVNFEVYYSRTIENCEILRRRYVETGDKKYWRALIQLLPSSYNQKRTITMSYENIHNMYHARHNHKLSEWREGFVNWIKTLPYGTDLIMI